MSERSFIDNQERECVRERHTHTLLREREREFIGNEDLVSNRLSLHFFLSFFSLVV